MKLVRFSTNGQQPRLGIIRGDRIADLQTSLAATLTRRGVMRAGEIAATLVPPSTRAFLEGGPAAEEAVAGIKEWVTVPAASARLHAPIADPGKFICIGLNYRDHAEEANQPIPKEPPIFAKWSNAILDPGEPILRPRGSSMLDWEVELGVVIGRTARFVPKERALDYVWGYTIINDVSARDFRAGRPVHRRPNRDSGSARPRAQAVGQRQADAERQHQDVHLRRPLSRELPLGPDHPLARRPHRDGHAAGRRLRAQAAGLPAAGRHVPAGDHRPGTDREPREGGMRRESRCSM